MKKIFYIIPLLGLASLTNCTKKLEQQPQGVAVDQNFYKTNNDMISAVNAAYDPLGWESSQNTNIVYFNFFFGDIASDDAIAGGNGAEVRVLPYSTFSVNSTDVGLSELWKKYYVGIYRCNLVITKAPLSNASDAIKNQVTGEAKFLRAFYYFKLTEMFGGVPLITSLLTADEYQQAKASKDELYGQMEADLKDAASLLPKKGDIQLGRATSGAAKGLLAKVYLFQSKWNDLLTTAEDVINSKVYGLEPVFGDNFSYDSKKENGIESLFEIQATNALAVGDERQNEGTFMDKYITPRNDGGYGLNVPSDELVNEFKQDSALWGKMDPRKKETIISNGDSVMGELVTTTNASGAPLTQGVNYYTRKYFVLPSAIVNYVTNGPSNQKIIRFSDVLLMAAEAAYNLGDESTARKYVDSVRARVKMPKLSSKPAVYTGDALKNAIWKERRLELAMEGHRFFDLVRQGRAAQVIGATAEGHNFVAGKNEVWPIPQSEIDLSQGKLIQNPNY